MLYFVFFLLIVLLLLSFKWQIFNVYVFLYDVSFITLASTYSCHRIFFLNMWMNQEKFIIIGLYGILACIWHTFTFDLDGTHFHNFIVVATIFLSDCCDILYILMVFACFYS